MIDIEHKDFIGIYRDVYPPGFCQHMIDNFERLTSGGAGYTRLQGEKALPHTKDDLQLVVHLGDHLCLDFVHEEQNVNAVDMFFVGLQRCYDNYVTNYSMLSHFDLKATAVKLQKTSPGGGYHIWHFEDQGAKQRHRVLTYMLYLNSLPSENDGGETEFLYQRQRIKPQENTMVLWPAGYTHTHRGNPVLSEKYKYIITGWFFAAD